MWCGNIGFLPREDVLVLALIFRSHYFPQAPGQAARREVTTAVPMLHSSHSNINILLYASVQIYQSRRCAYHIQSASKLICVNTHHTVYCSVPA